MGGKAYRIGDEVLVNFGMANVGSQVFMTELPAMLRGIVNAEDYSAFMLELQDEVEEKAVRRRFLLNGSYFRKKREFNSTIDEVVQRWSPTFNGALSWAHAAGRLPAEARLHLAGLVMRRCSQEQCPLAHQSQRFCVSQKQPHTFQHECNKQFLTVC